jgi:predicted HTH domain antitoxin
MSDLKVEIELPHDLLIALNVPVGQVGTKVKEWLVLALVQDGQISTGKAAEILGMTRGQCMDMLRQHRIPYLDWDSDELADEERVAMHAVSPQE